MKNEETSSPPSSVLSDACSERTRVSLLEKVKDPENRVAWNRFYSRYNTLIRSYASSYVYAKHIPMTHDDVEDVVLIVMSELGRKMGDFVYRPGKRAFRKFLATVTRRRCIDYLRKKNCRPDWDVLNPIQAAVGEDDDKHRTGPIDNLPDDDTGELSKEIEAHDMTMGRDLALEILRADRNVTRHKYSIFEKVVLGVPVSDICAEFGIQPGVVYTTKSLVMPYYEKALHKAKAELDEPSELPPAF